MGLQEIKRENQGIRTSLGEDEILSKMRLNKRILGLWASSIVVDLGMQRMQLSRTLNPRRRQTGSETQKKMEKGFEKALLVIVDPSLTRMQASFRQELLLL